MLLAFSAVYLTDGAGEHAESLGAAEIASNLMHLVKHCDASEVRACFCLGFRGFVVVLLVALLIGTAYEDCRV